MSQELMYNLITRMHSRLNRLIESCNYNLMDKKVQKYSRRVDRAILRYNRMCKKIT